MPARSRGSIGGESEAPGAKCVRRLKLVTVSRVRHSTVSLYRVHLLKKVRLFVFIIDESKVEEIIAQNNQDLLSMINYLVSTSISDLKQSSDSNAAEQMSEVKRPKRDDHHRLNSPACLQRSIFSLPSQICRPLFFVWKARSLENFLSKRSFFCKSSQSAGQVSFSLSSAPYLFPKLLKPLVKKWRSEGKHIVVFLDDSLGAAFNHIKAKIYSLVIHSDLFKSGSTEIIHKLRLQT